MGRYSDSERGWWSTRITFLDRFFICHTSVCLSIVRRAAILDTFCESVRWMWVGDCGSRPSVVSCVFRGMSDCVVRRSAYAFVFMRCWGTWAEDDMEFILCRGFTLASARGFLADEPLRGERSDLWERCDFLPDLEGDFFSSIFKIRMNLLEGG